MKKIVASAMLAAGLSVSAADASSIQLEYQNSGTPFGGDGSAEIVRIASTGFSGRVRAGGFHMTDNGALGDFIAFCVDLSQFLANNATYHANDMLFNEGVQRDIARLYSVAGDNVGDRVGSAAFQVALWEIISDFNDDSVYDLDAGSFLTVQGADGSELNDAVETLADGFLADLTNGDETKFRLSFYESATNQDLVTASPVPLPASSLLLGGALAGFAALRRRRKSA